MQEITNALTWTFIHSLWQGLLAALLSAIIISCTRSSTARLRYNLLGIVIILFLCGSALTFLTQWRVESRSVIAVPITIIDEVQITNAVNAPLDNFKVWVNANSDFLMIVWTFFFLFSCFRLLTGIAAVNRLRHYKTHPVPFDWKQKVEQLQITLGIRYSVSIIQSQLVKVPMALGILKPVILLPLGLITHLPPEQVETILLHELAHIRRRDYLFNLLQHIIEAIFFFNPAIRWISSLLRQEREACCDDIVIANCKHKTNYLNALVSFQEYSFSHGSTFAMGISGKRHYLLNRVRRMITNKNRGTSFFETIALLIAIILFSAFSYVTQKPAVKPVRTENKLVYLQTEETVPLVESKPQPRKKQKIKVQNKPSRDTTPVKKDTIRKSKKNATDKPLTKPTAHQQATMEANAVLQEIIQLKDRIGVRKEGIGVIKEKLKTDDEKEKVKMQKVLEQERDELDRQRKELDVKRAKWEILKKIASQKQAEEKQLDAKPVIKNEKFANTANNADPCVPADKWNKSKEPDKTIQLNKSKEPDKTIQWDKSDEPDKSDPWDKPNEPDLKTIEKPAAPASLKSPGTPPKKVPPARPGFQK